MKKSFRILLIVAVVMVSALLAAFTVPVKHYVTYSYIGTNWSHEYYYERFVDGVFLENATYMEYFDPSALTTIFYAPAFEIVVSPSID